MHRYFLNMRLVVSFIFLCFAIALSLVSFGQTKRMTRVLNGAGHSQVFPSLTSDGNTIVFLSNYTNDGKYELFTSKRISGEVWEEAITIPKTFVSTIDHFGSFNMSYDGNFIFFSSGRGRGIGGYDIWYIEKVNGSWSLPKNLGLPLNSTGHEGNPSLSADGRRLYFMRCERMDTRTKENCQIYYAERKGSRWSEPVKLPDHLNEGHTTTPRILPDNQTLVFSSDKPGGKGKLDVYQSKFDGQNWSEPVNLDYFNNEGNNEQVSIPAKGDILYYTGVHQDQFNLYMALIPENYRQESIVMMKGTLSAIGSPNLRIYDAESSQMVEMPTIQNKGEFSFVLSKGNLYDVSCFPEEPGYFFYSKLVDTRYLSSSDWSSEDIELASIGRQRTHKLNAIRFKPYSSMLEEFSQLELKRVSGLIRQNQQYDYEIEVYLKEKVVDSIPNPDLTEIVYDTVFYHYAKPVAEIVEPIETEIDSSELISGSVVQEDTIFNEPDSMQFETKSEEQLSIEDFDAFGLDESDGGFTVADSLILEGFELLEEDDIQQVYFKVAASYHNDRTESQAQELVNKLIQLGVPEQKISGIGYGEVWEEDQSDEENNYWVILRVK